MINTTFMKGQRHFLRGEYGRSIKEFNSAQEEGMALRKVYVPRGLAHLKNGDFLEAEDDFSRALDLDPTNDHLYFLRGMAYLNNGNLSKAVDDFTESLRFNAGRGVVFVARSLAFKGSSRGRDAENDLKAAVAMADVEVELFIGEYCIAPTLYNLALSLFDVEKAAWGKELWAIRSDLTN